MFHVAKSNGLRDLSLKCAITVTKYPDIIAQDKAFYQAGMAARQLGNNNLAFMLLNKYVLGFVYLFILIVLSPDMWI